MSTVEEIEAAIEKLPRKDVARLTRWLIEYDAQIWDKQLEADAKSGRLDKLWKKAEKELRLQNASARPHIRVQLPLFRASRPDALKLTNAQIEEIEALEDAADAAAGRKALVEFRKSGKRAVPLSEAKRRSRKDRAISTACAKARTASSTRSTI
jgi:hypothetical protein